MPQADWLIIKSHVANIGAICLRMRVFWCSMMQNGGFRRNYDVLDFNEIHQCFFYSDVSSIIWK